MKVNYLILLSMLLFGSAYGHVDSLNQKSWIRNKMAFGRSQHIQYLRNNNGYKTNTLLNKSYYASFAPIQIKGFKAFVSLNYEYFITQAFCFTCIDAKNNISNVKQLHFINFASFGIGLKQELTFKNKKGKEWELTFGAAVERYLFRKAIILNHSGEIQKATPFLSKQRFFNHYFFKDAVGVRVYNSQNYKVFIQLSGLLLRNERLYYAPSRHTFHNFMLGFNVCLK